MHFSEYDLVRKTRVLYLLVLRWRYCRHRSAFTIVTSRRCYWILANDSQLIYGVEKQKEMTYLLNSELRHWKVESDQVCPATLLTTTWSNQARNSRPIVATAYRSFIVSMDTLSPKPRISWKSVLFVYVWCVCVCMVFNAAYNYLGLVRQASAFACQCQCVWYMLCYLNQSLSIAFGILDTWI